jgi:ketosteroid isomerase-like protein
MRGTGFHRNEEARPMRTQRTFVVWALVIAGGSLTSSQTFGQDAPADEAMTLARKLTEEGAATYSKGDAKAMAAYYTQNAIVFLQGKNDDGHSVKEYDGRTEIEGLYADLFKDHKTMQSRNTVEYARLLAPDLLVIAGTFEPDQLAEKPMKVPFYQVRIKQGDKWLIHSLRVFVLPEKS